MPKKSSKPFTRNKGWVQVRVDESTHRKLTAFLQRMQNHANSHADTANPWAVGGACLSDAIRELLFREDCHNARGVAYCQRRRKTDRKRRTTGVAKSVA